MRYRKRKNKKKIIIVSALSLLLLITAGYAAFETNLSISAKGNIVKRSAGEYLRTLCTTTSGSGLYADIYEEGRCIYKGAYPNNYIRFNNNLWRIISVESDDSIKIAYTDSIIDGAFDDSNSNVWETSSLNTYLNTTYYNSLPEDAKAIVTDHEWSVGPVIYNNTDLANQIISESSIKWTGKIGMISVSEYIRMNENTEQCGNFNLFNSNNCSTWYTDYLQTQPSMVAWSISPMYNSLDSVFYFSTNGINGIYYDSASGDQIGATGAYPSLYLSNNIVITGDGSLFRPYEIETS